jgi:DNA invertase Pin-like site-specific DNA recombinase
MSDKLVEVSDKTLQSDQIKRCFECDQPATYQHHVVPESLGGTKTVPLCGHCHPKAHGEKGYWKTGELIKTQLQKRKEQGKWVGGQIPYGKVLDKDRLVDCPEEIATIELMVKWRLEGQTYLAIAAQLTEMGAPTKLKTPNWRSYRVQQIVARYIQDPFTRRDLIKKKKLTGKLTGKFMGGYPPYGYQIEDGRQSPNRTEGDIIKRIYVMHMLGHSNRSIAGSLNAQGITSQRQKTWRHVTIGAILQANVRKRARWTRARL